MHATPRTRVLLVSTFLVALLVTGCGVEARDDAGGSPDVTIETPDDTTPVTVGPVDDTTTTTEDDDVTTTTEDDDDVTTTTERDDDTTTTTSFDDLDPDELSRQIMVDLFKAYGLDDTKSGCLADKLLAAGETSADLDDAAAQQAFEECGVDASVFGG